MITEFTFKGMKFKLEYHIVTQEDIDEGNLNPPDTFEWDSVEVGEGWVDIIWMIAKNGTEVLFTPEFFRYMMEPDEDFHIAWSDAMIEHKKRDEQETAARCKMT